MSTIIESITVDVAAHNAYARWSQWDHLWAFTDGAHGSQPRWDGPSRAVEEPGRFGVETLLLDTVRTVSWAPATGPTRFGSMEFESIDEHTTRVTAQLDMEPDGFVASLADKLGIAHRRLKRDLQLFKEFVESGSFDGPPI
jgi:uncharacterized membrane protein